MRNDPSTVVKDALSITAWDRAGSEIFVILHGLCRPSDTSGIARGGLGWVVAGSENLTAHPIPGYDTGVSKPEA